MTKPLLSLSLLGRQINTTHSLPKKQAPLASVDSCRSRAYITKSFPTHSANIEPILTANRFQMAWLWVIWLISTFWLSFVYDWTAISTGIYHGILPYAQLSKLRMGLHIFGRAVSIFLVAGIPFTLFPFGQALWWTVSFYSVWGFLFMLITQVNHIVEDCLEAADEKVTSRHLRTI